MAVPDHMSSPLHVLQRTNCCDIDPGSACINATLTGHSEMQWQHCPIRSKHKLLLY